MRRVLFRETPLHLGHCHNILGLTAMGGTVMPPVSAFWPRPKTIDEMVTYPAARALDLSGIEVEIDDRRKEDQFGR